MGATIRLVYGYKDRHGICLNYFGLLFYSGVTSYI